MASGSLILTGGLGLAGSASGTPVINNFVPTAGSTLGVKSAIQFDVTDSLDPFREVFVVASYDNWATRELVYDGDGFNPAAYSGAVNTRTVITNGYRFTMLRDGGWIGPVSLKVYAIDTGGGENT